MYFCRANPTRFFLVLRAACLSLAYGLFAFGLTASTLAQSPAPTATATESYAKAWKQSQLTEIENELAAAPDQAARSELRARKSWLRAWQPGQMDRLDAFKPRQQQLRSEPDLTDLRGQIPGSAQPALEKAIELRQRIERLDAIDVRKENLHETVAVSEEFVRALESIPGDALDANDRDKWRWAIAFARYRQARALGYQELPDVVQRQPIEDPEGLDRRLRQVYGELRSLFEDSQPEFVLLDVRMLRRDQQYGRALQLLERHRATIDGKWYLKKRRDLLEELDWIPPWKEAAAIYHESGLGAG